MKKFKNNIIILIFCMILGCGLCYSEPAAQDVNAPQQQTVQTQTAQPEEIPETIPEKNYENLMKIKDNASSSKVLSSLIWIILGLLVLFGGFGLYKLYRNLKEREYIVDAPIKETLATPKDFKTAINLFLGKTDE